MGLPIGAAATRVGVAVSTLRYWERQGLIAPGRAPSGDRRYDTHLLRRMAFLRLAGFLGLPLNTATQILDSAPSDRHALADAEIARLDTLIQRARGAQRLLANARDCPHTHALYACPAMEQAFDRLLAEGDPAMLDPASQAAGERSG